MVVVIKATGDPMTVLKRYKLLGRPNKIPEANLALD